MKGAVWTYRNWTGKHFLITGDEYYRRTLLLRVPFTTRAVVFAISRPGVLYNAQDFPDARFERWQQVRAAAGLNG